MHSRLILVFTIPALLMIPTMAQSGFTEYDNKYFTMAYPRGWTVNNTKFGDLLMCCYHDVIFTSPNANAKITLEVYGFVVPPRDLVTLDKDYWQNLYGNIISIDNQTQYMSGRQAVVVTLTANTNKQINVITFAPAFSNVNCNTSRQLLTCQPFQFTLTYTTSIDNFPTYLNQFQTMVTKLHVNG